MLARNEPDGPCNRRGYFALTHRPEPRQPDALTPSLYPPPRGGSEVESEIDEWFKDLGNQTTSADTKRGYLYSVRKFAEFAKARKVATIDSIGRALITDWYETFRKRGVAETSIHRHACGLRSFLRYCRDVGYVDRTLEAPKIRRKQKRLHRALTDEQVAAILGKIGHRALMDIRDRALLLFLLSTGCRPTEACNVELNDLRFYIDAADQQERAEVLIRHGKGDKERLVWLNPNGVEALRVYMAKARRPASFPLAERALFVSREGNPIDRKLVTRTVRRRAQDAGIPAKVTGHWMRHTFATAALGRGVDLHKVSKMLGHSNLETTATYLHVVPDDLRRAHKLMDNPPNMVDHLERVDGQPPPPKPMDDHRRRRRD